MSELRCLSRPPGRASHEGGICGAGADNAGAACDTGEVVTVGANGDGASRGNWCGHAYCRGGEVPEENFGFRATIDENGTHRVPCQGCLMAKCQ